MKHYACARGTVGDYEVTIGLGFDPAHEQWREVLRWLTHFGFWDALGFQATVIDRSQPDICDSLRGVAERWMAAVRPGTSWYVEIERAGQWVQVYERDARAPQPVTAQADGDAGG